MLDTTKELTYPLKVLARKLPVRRSSVTIKRWIFNGWVNPRTRVAIKMEFALVGGCMHSSVEAYQRWVDACTKAKTEEHE